MVMFGFRVVCYLWVGFGYVDRIVVQKNFVQVAKSKSKLLTPDLKLAYLNKELQAQATIDMIEVDFEVFHLGFLG